MQSDDNNYGQHPATDGAGRAIQTTAPLVLRPAEEAGPVPPRMLEVTHAQSERRRRGTQWQGETADYHQRAERGTVFLRLLSTALWSSDWPTI